MNETIKEIFAEEGIIKQLKEDYVPRESQITGSHMLSDTLMNTENAILEGPCGFGKSFCYLVPVFEDIAQSEFKKKAVIVTDGISLQEQLYHKDLPFVKKIFNEVYPDANFKFTMLKGKQNFVCLKKMESVIADSVAVNSNNPETEKEIKKIIDWSLKTKTGDLSELDFVPTYEVASMVSCNKEGECTGRKCPKYDACHYVKFRMKCFESNIIVTNYHMLYADYQTGNSILPTYDILVCDEAHKMANIFRDFLGCKISTNTVKSIRNDIHEVLNKDKILKDKYEETVNTAYLVATAEKYFAQICKGVFKSFEDIKLLDTLTLSHEANLADAIKITEGVCEDMANYIKRNLEAIKPDDMPRDELTDEELKEYDKLDVLHNKVCHALDELASHRIMISNYKEESQKPEYVWWLEKEKDKDGKDTGLCSMNNRPVKVANTMAENFFEKQNLSVIMTSATLSVGGNFDFIKEETGLGLCTKKVNEFIGESPFDLTKQQLWYLPEDAVDGNDNANFEGKYITQIDKIVSQCGGGTLCLFTSVKSMNKAFNELKWSCNHTLLKQGMKPRMQLIEDFKNDVNSVLFATKSFFTGVDIPGNALRCVILDKFPFPSPADPVMQKLSKENNSFFKYFIPMMVIDLKQAVGRGVRSIDDKCVIAILDGRMSTARYKARINNSFPYQKSGTRDINAISEFLGDFTEPETPEWDSSKIDYSEDEPF